MSLIHRCARSSRIVDSALPLIVACLGCSGDPGGGATGTSGGEVSGSSGTSGDASGASTAQGSTEAETETTSTSYPCGDGIKDPEEACDDGNSQNGDGCNVDCQPSGALRWTYLKDGGKTDIAYGVGASATGVVAVGTSFVDGQDFNGWVVALDEDGALQWETSVDEGGVERFLAVSVTGDGRFVAAGARGDADKNIWVRGFSAGGAIEWSDDVDSGFGHDFARGAAGTAGGEFAVAGVRSLEGGGGELWVRRYGQGGAIQSTATHPYGYDVVWALGPGVTIDEVTGETVVGFVTQSGARFPELLVGFPATGGAAAWTYESLADQAQIHGVASRSGGLVTTSWDAVVGFVVASRSSDGALIWSSASCEGSVGHAIAVDPGDGSVAAIGQGPGATGASIRLCKFSADGQLLWGHDIDGGVGDDRGWAVTILADGTIVAAGDQMAVIGAAGAASWGPSCPGAWPCSSSWW